MWRCYEMRCSGILHNFNYINASNPYSTHSTHFFTTPLSYHHRRHIPRVCYTHVRVLFQVQQRRLPCPSILHARYVRVCTCVYVRTCVCMYVRHVRVRTELFMKSIDISVIQICYHHYHYDHYHHYYYIYYYYHLHHYPSQLRSFPTLHSLLYCCRIRSTAGVWCHSNCQLRHRVQLS